MTNEDEAISVFSSELLLLLTYLICAFLSRLLLAISKIPVIVRKSAYVPSCVGVNVRVRKIKLMKPKNVSEKRCKKV